MFLFQSTLPLRGATGNHCDNGNRLMISIHAPLTGSDPLGPCGPTCSFYFNPRSPYGERRYRVCKGSRASKFQSTLPLRGATSTIWVFPLILSISIHAPLTGSDRLRLASWYHPENFNPRSPYGERLGFGGRAGNTKMISIHAPLTGSDHAAASKKI